MLVTHDASIAERARYLATQARQPVSWYEHEDVGFNYRMSNVLAALGRAQLRRLPGIIERRHEIRARYAKRLGGVDGISVTADPEWGRSNAWLTTILLPEDGPTPTEASGHETLRPGDRVALESYPSVAMAWYHAPSQPRTSASMRPRESPARVSAKDAPTRATARVDRKTTIATSR